MITNNTFKRVSIDIATICQLKCRECSTAKGIIKNGLIKSGTLSFSDFKKFVDVHPSIEEIELSNWGEIFLNKDIKGILKYAHKYNIKLTAGNGVNFNQVGDEILEALVKYRFYYMNISIDGASQETYELYRVNGDYNKVIKNIIKLNDYKNLYNSDYPKLSWQFIIFGHNEHEILKAKKMANQLNLKFNPKLNHTESFSPIINHIQVKEDSELNETTREEFKIKNNRNYKRPCCQLWYSPQINWNGDVLGCCVNKWKSLGNVFQKNTDEIFTSGLFKKTKDVLEGKLNITEDLPCFYCPTYLKIKDKPITDEEIIYYSNFTPKALDD